MGHRLSKSVTSVVTNQQQQRSKNSQENQQEFTNTQTSQQNENLDSLIISPITPSSSTSSPIVLDSISSSEQNLRLESATLTVPAQVAINSNIPRRFIIKIQLTKMEPGCNDANNDNSPSATTTTYSTTTLAVDDNNIENITCDNTNDSTVVGVSRTLDNNLNIRKPVLNLTFTKNIPHDVESASSLLPINQQIVIENDNETTIQLNNLNAPTATINSNFVNNFATIFTSDASTSSLTMTPILDEDDNGRVVEQLNNLDIETASGHTFSSNITNPDNLSNSITNNNIINLSSLNNNNRNNISNSYNNNNNSISNINQNVEYQDIPDINQRISTDSGNQTFGSTMCNTNDEDEKSHCCRTKKSSAYPAKWRCCKCSCRDAMTKLTNTLTAPSTNKSTNQESSSAKPSSSKSSWTSKFTCSSKKDTTETKPQNVAPINLKSPSTSSSTPTSSLVSPSSVESSLSPSSVTHAIWAPNGSFNPLVPSTSQQQQQQRQPQDQPQQQQQEANRLCPRTDHLTMWEPILPLTPFIEHHHHHHHHHHIQTIARCPAGNHNVLVVSVNSQASPQQPAQQIVIGQVEDLDERARRLRALEIETGIDQIPLESALANVLSPQNPWHHIMCSPTTTSNCGTVVHSQVDYIHCLVPDLEKITSSSFYWGKMDRYEAEKLLEGKPEGTFLLRDSAQEEYLFSVTFRKYGRSLHARIEQFNHKFSFDGHDPGVFTAKTVTGLLEHYKDPSLVMFFEPMLTIPLHRNFTFSLQQLCRATIVSHITYDGINELQLPTTLKSYLKEYHYKLRVRVKPFDELFYTCS